MPSDPPPDEPDYEAFAIHAASMLGLSVDPGWRGPIAANLRVLHAAAALVTGFPLPDEAEAAPVFTA